MIANEVTTTTIVIVIAYLLGSINSAYLITGWMTGKDIRTLGGGNAGGRNVFREVGLKAAVPVAIFDVGKGAGAIAIAYWLLEVSRGEITVGVILAGLAVVAGHMWSVYLRFTGGNGLAAAVGALAVMMPQALVIVLAIMLVLGLITRNPVLSLNIGLLSLPLSSWLLLHSGLAVIFSALLIIIMVLNFLPTARAALAEAGSGKALSDELLHRNRNQDSTP